MLRAYGKRRLAPRNVERAFHLWDLPRSALTLARPLSRGFCSTPVAKPPLISDGHSERSSILVKRLNAAIDTYPLTVSFWYLYHRATIIGCVWGALTLGGVPVPHELGAAFLILGTLRNFKIPIVLAASAALVRARPELAQLRLAALLAKPLEAIWDSLGGGARRGGASSAAPEAAQPASLASRVKALLPAFLAPSAAAGGSAPRPEIGSRAGGLVDRFGLAYVLSARGVAAVALASTATALHWGVDLAPALTWLGGQWGLGDGAGAAAWGAAAADGISRWAAAGLALNVAYPWVLRWAVAELAMAAGPRWVERSAQGWRGVPGETLIFCPLSPAIAGSNRSCWGYFNCR